MERQRKAQARHLALLSSDAPVANRCAKEEAHLKQRLAQSTAALTRSARQNQAAAEREERTREMQLHAQFTALLSNTPGIHVPPLALSGEVSAADTIPASAANNHSSQTPPSRAAAAGSSRVAEPTRQSCASTAGDLAEVLSSSPSSSPAYVLGFPEPYESSGFKSAVHWASVAYDETFLTAYGPRRLREEIQASTVAEAGGVHTARDARPHRLMAAVACYLLNEVLCADTTVSALWQEKLRQPIFDAIFSSQTIAAGQEKRKTYQSLVKAGNEAARSHVIVQHTLGATTTAAGGGGNCEIESAAATVGGAVSASPSELPFPPRTNAYVTRADFASMRLWTEEVTAEQRDKAMLCRRVRTLQGVMERRLQLLDVYQKQSNEATMRAIFTVWRTHTKQSRAYRVAMERYLENRRCRVLEETVFLRWRRVTLQTKVELLQRRMLNIVAEREEVARQHAADLAVVQEQLDNERRRHHQAAYEQDALHTQILESHSMEVEALRLVLRQQRAQTAEIRKWSRRWERLAKTFRPAQQCPPVPSAMWTLTRALYSSEESVVATVLGKGGDRRVLQQMPYSMILPIRERLERLLLAWVNEVMEKSPLASAWVPLETFMHGRTTRPRSILVTQKTDAEQPSRGRASAASAATSTAANNAESSYLTEFGVYTLMAFVRELRRLYIRAGKMPDTDTADARLPRGTGFGGSGRTSLAKCFREVVEVLSVQTCAGLYPSLLTHCPSLVHWFNPEGVFGGPTQSFEGAGKERRLQHTMFVWLLTALLVGHIRLTLLAPAGERDDGLPPPSPGCVSLQCSREAELDRIPQINFPVEAALIAREAVDANVSSSAAARNSVAQGTSVVSQNTFLSKKIPNAPTSRASKASTDLAKNTGFAGGSETAASAAAAKTVTLETALRERSRRTNDALLDAEDSLSDIEAYLGLLTAQARSLRHPGNGSKGSSGTGSRVSATITPTAGSSKTRSDDGDDNDLVTGLLQQLVEARDAAAQSRRMRRMQRTDENAVGVVVSGAKGEQEAFATSTSEDREDTYLDEDEEDANAHTVTAQLQEGRASTVLSSGQLRILRSLPARSGAFDSVRPIPPASKPATAAAADDDDASTTLESEDAASNSGPTGKFYSFLLNTLEDVARRQQWAGLARVVTSLVVRFHILDDVEDGVQRLATLQAAREDPAKEEAGSRRASAHPRPSSAVSSVAAASQSARLPSVSNAAGATTARESGASKAKKQSFADNRGIPMREGSLSVQERGSGGSTLRVPARLVAAHTPPSSLSPKPAEARFSTNTPPPLRVSVASVGEDLVRSSLQAPDSTPQPAEKTSLSFTRDSTSPKAATIPSPPVSKKSSPLLGAHVLRKLRGELSTRGRHVTSTSTASSSSQRNSASMSEPVVAPASAAKKGLRSHGEAATPLSPPSTKLISLPTSLLNSFNATTPLPDKPEDRDVCGGAEKVGGHASTGADSADSSIVLTTMEATVDEFFEAVTESEANSALPVHESDELEPSLDSSPVAPSMPPLPNAMRRNTLQFSTSQYRSQTSQEDVSAADARAQAPVQPAGHPSGLHQGPALAPTPPATRQVPSEVVGGENAEGGSEDGPPQDQLGYLDPLIEHGANQSSSAAQNTRKYRFHMQPQ